MFGIGPTELMICLVPLAVMVGIIVVTLLVIILIRSPRKKGETAKDNEKVNSE